MLVLINYTYGMILISLHKVCGDVQHSKADYFWRQWFSPFAERALQTPRYFYHSQHFHSVYHMPSGATNCDFDYSQHNHYVSLTLQVVSCILHAHVYLLNICKIIHHKAKPILKRQGLSKLFTNRKTLKISLTPHFSVPTVRCITFVLARPTVP